MSETVLRCGSIPSIPTKNQMHLTFAVYENPEKNGLLFVFNHSSLASKAPTGSRYHIDRGSLKGSDNPDLPSHGRW